MIIEAFGTAETVDEAKENAEILLKAENKIRDNEEINFEIVEMPKAKIFGFLGGRLAKVRVYVERPDVKERKKGVASKPAATSPAEKKPSASKQKSAAKSVEKTANAAKPQTAAADVGETDAVKKPGVPAENLDPSSRAGKAAAYLKAVLAQLGCTDARLTVVENEDSAEIDIEGEHLGIVIGRRGETLDALQYLTSLSANVKGAGYYRVVINIGDFRGKRAESLKGLAHKISRQVLRTGRSRSLEPMNPYERRIVHTAVQEIDGVYSKSIGEGARRHIIISPENPVRRPRRTEAAAGAAGAAETHKKTDAENLPLYGRIDK